MMRTSRAILIMLVVLAAPVLLQAQTTWYVDDDCSPPGTGTEVDPFCTFQDSVDAASDGDTVLVAPGTYTGEGNRDISLFGKAIELRSSDGPTVTVMDIEGDPDSVHRGFILIHGGTQETVIEGFTIVNGYLIGDTGGVGTGTPGGGGAAFMIRDSSPTIRNCIMTNNTSADDGNPFIADGLGGGVYVDGGSSAIIENCIIANNVSENRGGGMYIGFEASAVSIQNCLISGNSASNGGGIHHVFGSSSIINTAIINNASVFGGGASTVNRATHSSAAVFSGVTLPAALAHKSSFRGHY